jgi:hypothetical protein
MTTDAKPGLPRLGERLARELGEREATIMILALLIARETIRDPSFADCVTKAVDKRLGAIGPKLKQQHGDKFEDILVTARAHTQKLLSRGAGFAVDVVTTIPSSATDKTAPSFWRRLFKTNS